MYNEEKNIDDNSAWNYSVRKITKSRHNIWICTVAFSDYQIKFQTTSTRLRNICARTVVCATSFETNPKFSYYCCQHKVWLTSTRTVRQWLLYTYEVVYIIFIHWLELQQSIGLDQALCCILYIGFGESENIISANENCQLAANNATYWHINVVLLINLSRSLVVEITLRSSDVLPNPRIILWSLNVARNGAFVFQ